MPTEPIGWMNNTEEADAYFDVRLENTAWFAFDDDKKDAAITTAYNRIYYDKRYDVPTYDDATAAQLVVLKIVNCEMAYYLAVHLADEDRRKGLHAQGVLEAGIVKEVYDKDMLTELPVPPFVDAILEDAGFVTEAAFGMVNLDRDEDESVDEKVDDF